MLPDQRTLDLLLALGQEFNPDGGGAWITALPDAADEADEAAGTDLVGACWHCKRVQDDSKWLDRRPPGLTPEQAAAIKWWAFLRDGREALAFLRRHEQCRKEPRLDR